MRLGTEVGTPEGLKQQAKCFLACLNCLKLVNPKYAWIIKPMPRVSRGQEHQPRSSALPVGVSPKRSNEGEEIVIENFDKPVKMTVLEMSDIEKDFELVCSRIKLASKIGDKSGGVSALSAGETVSLLINANLFEDAIHICNLFDLSFKPIVEGLASRAVKLAR